jgi:hypothetical protein
MEDALDEYDDDYCSDDDLPQTSYGYGVRNTSFHHHQLGCDLTSLPGVILVDDPPVCLNLAVASAATSTKRPQASRDH